MATITILQSYLNPIKFHELNRVQSDRYVSKHMNDFAYIETIPEWETRRPYAQPFQTNDTIALQIESNYNPVQIEVLGANGIRRYATQLFDLKRTYKNQAGWFLFEVIIQLSTLNLADGFYFLKITTGPDADIVLISEPLEIRQRHKNSLLLEYRHAGYYHGVYFQTGFSPSLRVRGRLKYDSPSSKDLLFEHKRGRQLLEADVFDSYRLSIGGPSGIPDYLARMLGRILTCSVLLIDGRAMTKAENAKLEPTGAANYPMRSWEIDVNETQNMNGTQHSDDAVITGRIAVVLTTDGKGFGLDTSGSTANILDV